MLNFPFTFITKKQNYSATCETRNRFWENILMAKYICFPESFRENMCRTRANMRRLTKICCFAKILISFGKIMRRTLRVNDFCEMKLIFSMFIHSTKCHKPNHHGEQGQYSNFPMPSALRVS
jgi:hypothetical protein